MIKTQLNMPLLKPQHDRLINLNAITVALVEHNSTQKLTQLKSKSANCKAIRSHD